MLGMLALVIALGAVSPAGATVVASDQRCTQRLSKQFMSIARAESALVKRCTRGAAGGGEPIAACTARESGGVLAAKDRLRATATSATCANASFQPIDVDAIIDTATSVELAALRAIAGRDRDLDAAIQAQPQCQLRVIRALAKCQSARLKTFARCKKLRLRRTASTPPIDTLADLETACLMRDGDETTRQPDPTGILDRRCHRLFAQVVSESCAGAPLADTFQGCGADTVDETASCLDAHGACAACRAAGEVDRLGRDCDLFDNGLADGSCGESRTPVFAGIVAAQATSQSAIDLWWLPATDDATSAENMRYEVHLATAENFEPSSASLVQTLTGQIETAVNGLSPGTTYRLMVIAVDDDGRRSWGKHRAEVRTPEVLPAPSSKLKFASLPAGSQPAGRGARDASDNLNLGLPTSVAAPLEGDRYTLGSPGSGPGEFNNPENVALGFDESGAVDTLYVADELNDRVQKFTASAMFDSTARNSFVTSWAVNRPRGLAVAEWGDGSPDFPRERRVYVAERSLHRIKYFDGDGTYLGEWGGPGTGKGQFYVPQGIAVDKLGNVYVTDSENHRVQKFTADGAYLLEWGGFSWGGFAEGGGPDDDDGEEVVVPSLPEPGRFSEPTHLAVYDPGYGPNAADADVAACPNGMTIQGSYDSLAPPWSEGTFVGRISADGATWQVSVNDADPTLTLAFSGEISGTELAGVSDPAGCTVAGSIDCDDSTMSGTVTCPGNTGVWSAELLRETAIVYVVDWKNGRVQYFEPDGRFLGQWAVPADESGALPYGIAVDEEGQVYVTFRGSSRVLRYDRFGYLLGEWQEPGFGMSGIAASAKGGVYGADYGNGRIEVFDARERYTFDVSDPVVGLTAGDILVIPQSGAGEVPKTTLREVLAYSQDGSNLTVWTDEATIAEALKDGQEGEKTLDLSGTHLVPAELLPAEEELDALAAIPGARAGRFARGKEVVTQVVWPDGRLSVEQAQYFESAAAARAALARRRESTTIPRGANLGYGVTLLHRLSLSPAAVFDYGAHWDQHRYKSCWGRLCWWKSYWTHTLDRAKFGVKGTLNAEAGLQVSTSAAVTRTFASAVPLWKTTVTNTVVVGVVPFVFVTEFQLDYRVQVGAKANTSATVKAKASSSVELGATYSSGRWQGYKVGPFFTQSLERNVTLAGGLAAEVRLIPKLTTKLYGVAGPRLSFEPYVNANLNVVADGSPVKKNVCSYVTPTAAVRCPLEGPCLELRDLSSNLAADLKLAIGIKLVKWSLWWSPADPLYRVGPYGFFSLPQLGSLQRASKTLTLGYQDGTNNSLNLNSIRWGATGGTVTRSSTNPPRATVSCTPGSDVWVGASGYGAIGELERRCIVTQFICP